MQKKSLYRTELRTYFFWCLLYIILAQEETAHSLIMCLCVWNIMSLLCVCVHILCIILVVCLCVCLFVNFLSILLKYYCIVFNHCVRNMFVC